jgi:hypothetical protein
LQNIVEKRFTVNKKVYIPFVDLLKAFDNINCNVMMKNLKMIKKYTTVIEELLESYTNIK